MSPLPLVSSADIQKILYQLFCSWWPFISGLLFLSWSHKVLSEVDQNLSVFYGHDMSRGFLWGTLGLSAPILSFYAFPLPFPLLPSLLEPRDWTIGPYIYFLFPPTIGLNEYRLNRELNLLVRDFLMDGCSVSSPLLGAVDVESNNN